MKKQIRNTSKKLLTLSLLTMLCYASLGIAVVRAITYDDCMGALESGESPTTCNQYATSDEEKNEAYCQTAYKMSCAQYTEQNKSATQAAEDKCKDAKDAKGVNFTSCAEKATTERMASGQGFKLSTNFLTLQTKDADGNIKTQQQSIFGGKYKQFGPIVGTLLRIIDILIYVIGSFAMLTLVAAGIFMIANHGDEAWVTKGKGMMLYSILGILVALLAFVIVNVITSAFS